MTPPVELAPDVLLWRGALDAALQEHLTAEIFERAKEAPFYQPGMPRTGHKLSVEMTNFGPLGWFTDAEKGYRYESCHPLTGKAWPSIPEILLRLWRQRAGYPSPPEACLVNLYRGRARMGMHRDADELARDAPVLSVSLGDRAIFRFGSARKHACTQTVVLESGSVLVFGGAARFMFHGIDRVLPDTMTLIPGGGRLNLTLRRVTKPKKKGGRSGG